MKRTVFLAAAAAFTVLAPVLGAQAACTLQDPISGQCLSTSGSVPGATQSGVTQYPAATGSGYKGPPLPITGAHGEVSAPAGYVGALGGVSERSAYYECAVYDEQAQRCKVKASTAEEREQALQAGFEAANSGLRIIHEVETRQRQGGVPLTGSAGSTSTTQAVASVTGTGTTSPALVAAQCFQSGTASLTSQLGRTPTTAELKTVWEGCHAQTN